MKYEFCFVCYEFELRQKNHTYLRHYKSIMTEYHNELDILLLSLDRTVFRSHDHLLVDKVLVGKVDIPLLDQELKLI